MKSIKIYTTFSILIVLTILLSGSAHASDKISRIKVAGMAVHYLNIEVGQFDLPEGYFKFPVTPGFEFILFRQLGENTEIGAGINYQNGRVASDVHGYRKYYFSDIGIPIVLRRDIWPQYYKNLYLTAGVYFGRNICKKFDNFQSSGWVPSNGGKMANIYFGDLYLDLERRITLSNNLDISLAPFVKYRIDKVWYNAYAKRTHFGIKLNVSYNLKN